MPADAFVQSASLGSLRNNYTGTVGFKFTVASTPLQVTSLGRIYVYGNESTHTVKIVDAAGFDIPGASVAVTMAGGTPGRFSYALLPNPIALSPNHPYYLVSQETSSGDAWYDVNTTLATSTGRL